MYSSSRGCVIYRIYGHLYGGYCTYAGSVLWETTFRCYLPSKFNVVVYAQTNNTFQATTNPLLVTSNIQELVDKRQAAIQFSAFHVPRLNSISYLKLDRLNSKDFHFANNKKWVSNTFNYCWKYFLGFFKILQSIWEHFLIF